MVTRGAVLTIRRGRNVTGQTQSPRVVERGGETETPGHLFWFQGREVNRTEAGGAAGVCAGVERARAALAKAGPVLEAVRRAQEAIPLPLPVLEVPHITRGARCPVGPVVPFLFVESVQAKAGRGCLGNGN